MCACICIDDERICIYKFIYTHVYIYIYVLMVNYLCVFMGSFGIENLQSLTNHQGNHYIGTANNRPQSLGMVHDWIYHSTLMKLGFTLRVKGDV